MKKKLDIEAIIYGSLESLLNIILSAPFYKMLWNDVKEKFGKDVDEKELYKVFKFFTLMLTFAKVLEDTKNRLLEPSILASEQRYILYRNKDFFDGKLDETTFRKLITEMLIYYVSEFYEKYVKNEEQKGEQPK